MPLLTSGYWPSTFWPINFWEIHYWQRYGAESLRVRIMAAVDTRFKAITLPGTYNSIRQKIIDAFDVRIKTV